MALQTQKHPSEVFILVFFCFFCLTGARLEHKHRHESSQNATKSHPSGNIICGKSKPFILVAPTCGNLRILSQSVAMFQRHRKPNSVIFRHLSHSAWF